MTNKVKIDMLNIPCRNYPSFQRITTRKDETVPVSIKQIRKISNDRVRSRSWLGTQSHTMLPTIKAILQVMFCKVVENLGRFCFHSIYRQKMSSFEHWLDPWEEVEVAKSENQGAG